MSTVTEQATGPRTAILTVDDDPAVSRAVARDLRRQYGEQYRIVRAESATDGLDALRQMKLRGDLVAVILADYRMPGQNGIEFLEQAMDIYPGCAPCWSSAPPPAARPGRVPGSRTTWASRTACPERS
jgi:thioredoxin reductase (NADPH)